MSVLLFASAAPRAGVLAPINHGVMPPDSKEFTFVALGDNRPAGAGLPPTKAFREIIREVGYIAPAFVLSSGDIVYGNEEPVAQYEVEAGQVAAILDKLNTPFFNAPGNHEIAGRPELQAEYEKRFGAMYGSFDYGGFRFIALSTDEAGDTDSIGAAQRAWLESRLAAGKPSFVFLHRPLFARVGNDEAGATVGGAAALHALFRAHGVKAVFEGHDHVYNRQVHDGIQYVITGGAGAPLDQEPPNGGFFHFLVVRVKDGTFTIDVVPIDAIQTTRENGETRVANYADCDLELGDFPISCARRPARVAAYSEKKGKRRPVKATIERVERTSAGYRVHVRFLLAKHVQTVLRPG